MGNVQLRLQITSYFNNPIKPNFFNVNYFFSREGFFLIIVLSISNDSKTYNIDENLFTLRFTFLKENIP